MPVALPTRQSVGQQPVKQEPVAPGKAALSLYAGSPSVRTEAGVQRYNVDDPASMNRFHAHMEQLGTPEAKAMQRAVATGHRWTVSEQAFPHFSKYDPQHIAHMGNAEKGDDVEFAKLSPHGMNPDGFAIHTLGQGANAGASARRRFLPNKGILMLDSSRAPHESPRGWGTRSLFNMVKGARGAGVHTLNMDEAAGYPGSKMFNGYYTWPRLGFQGKITPERSAKLPPHLQHFTDTHALFDHPEGAAYWKDHGGELYNLQFDTRPGSPHIKKLVSYLRGVQAARRGTK